MACHQPATGRLHKSTRPPPYARSRRRSRSSPAFPSLLVTPRSPLRENPACFGPALQARDRRLKGRTIRVPTHILHCRELAQRPDEPRADGVAFATSPLFSPQQKTKTDRWERELREVNPSATRRNVINPTGIRPVAHTAMLRESPQGGSLTCCRFRLVGRTPSRCRGGPSSQGLRSGPPPPSGRPRSEKACGRGWRGGPYRT